MTTQQFKLYQIKTIKNRYGEKEEEVLVDTIEVAINEQHKTAYQNDIHYLVKVVTGLTPYKGFRIEEKYFLTNDKNRYEIQSFIIGRWSQLLLKEVIV